MFWVGLMDGKGNIQVNHRHMKTLEYRLIINLCYVESNYNMLLKIAKTIGGTVRVVNNKKEVIWVVDNKETILEIIKIFLIFPPLTSRLTCQLKFLKICLKKNSINNFLDKRKLKYNNQLNIIKQLEESKIPNTYFTSWLSGFVEAKGCFYIRQNKNHSFSIELNDDFYILDNIKEFFNLSVTIKNPEKNFYTLESYKKDSLYRIISHFSYYPLLGEKSISLNKLIKYIQ